MNTATKCIVTTAFAWGLSTAALAQGNAGGIAGGNGAGRGGVGIATPNGNGETGTPGGPTSKHSTLHIKPHHKAKKQSSADARPVSADRPPSASPQ
ncbi:hypothetical protein [Caballeronia sp. Lep1P3]|uniref:hypothetical protein n=1 Tax=Caballeronia sp. Lep1P3 TaxID=2878150 RepID=UPI001FD0472D|nr:hypothetical protein [Caballeronia sp. Lep1P3]